MRLRQVFEIVHMLLEGGVVHQDVEAPQLPGGPIHRFLTKVRIGDVTRYHDAAAPLILDRRFGFLCIRMLVEVRDGDVRTFAREQYGDGTSNAQISTSN